MPSDVPAKAAAQEFTAVLPRLNEAETLGRCIEKAQNFFTGILGLRSKR